MDNKNIKIYKKNNDLPIGSGYFPTLSVKKNKY
jgi:hypothetical protein